MVYSQKFKERVLVRLLAPGAPSALSLAGPLGVSAATLCRWRRDSLASAVESKLPPPSPPPKKRAELTALEKVELLVDFDRLPEDKRGAFLRSHGLHQADLDQWQEALVEALDAGVSKRRKAEDKKHIAALEKELRRKDKALAEAAALLVLRKKVRALLGEGDDDTDPT